MTVPSRVESDLFVAGTLQATDIILSALSLDNSHVKANAAIAQTKLEHQHVKTFAQESATNVADEAKVLHVIQGLTGNVIGFRCGVVVAAAGAAIVDIDLLRNGSTILTAAVRIDNGDVAYAIVEGVINTAPVVVDDVIEVSIDETIGGGTRPKGLFVQVEIEEDSA